MLPLQNEGGSVPESQIRFRGLDIIEAIDALIAHDHGAIDSSIHDDEMRALVVSYLKSLDNKELQQLCARAARRFLTDEAISEGYGVRDVVKLVEWLEDLGVYI
jgi:hypothetical protein